MHKMEKLSLLAATLRGREEITRRELEETLAEHNIDEWDTDILQQLKFLLDNGYISQVHTTRGYKINLGGDKVSTG